MEEKLYLYGTSGCYLCEVAAEIVLPAAVKSGLPLHQIDIAGNLDLEARYETSIPVLQLYSRELRWPFDAEMVEDFLALRGS